MDELADIVTEDAAAVVEAVKQAVDEAGLNDNKLSKLACIPHTTLLRRLSGESPFKVSELSRIAAATGKHLRDLTRGREMAA